MEHLNCFWQQFLTEATNYRIVDWVMLVTSLLWVVVLFFRVISTVFVNKVVRVRVDDRATLELIKTVEKVVNLNSQHSAEAVEAIRTAHREALDTVKQVVISRCND